MNKNNPRQFTNGRAMIRLENIGRVLFVNKKDIGIAYVFLILPSLFFIHGIHRFYLGKPVSGFFYLITCGWFFIGTIIDLFTLGRQVRYMNVLNGNNRLY